MGARKEPARSGIRTRRGSRAATHPGEYSAGTVISHSVPVNAAVLRWARARRHLSLGQIQKSLRVSAGEIAAWENGTAQPTYVKAQQLARVLHIPFGFFFLSVPPDDTVPVPDLRTRQDHKPDAPSADLREVINDALRRQDWYREYAEENGAKPLPFIRKYSTASGASTVADNMRAVLRANEDMRSSCSSWDAYLTQLTRNAEVAGILVMRSGVVKHDPRRPLSPDEFQGFALTDDLAPVIFINVKDTVAARIFTLAHEAAHLWIGADGISAPGKITENASVVSTERVERFCHAVAAELLVPRMELMELWPRSGTAVELASQFARHFWVSRIVVLRRALELDLIGHDAFFSAAHTIKAQEKPPKKPDGGNPYVTIPSRNSVRFTDSVLGALRERRLVHTDAATLLALKPRTLLELARRRAVS